MALKNIGRKSVALSLPIVMASGAVAFGVVTQVGGGTWNYGTDSKTVFSNYLHGSKTHKASTINGAGNTHTSGWKPKDSLNWASSSQSKSRTGTDKAYWDTK